MIVLLFVTLVFLEKLFFPDCGGGHNSVDNSILYQSDYIVIEADVVSGFEKLTVESL